MPDGAALPDRAAPPSPWAARVPLGILAVAAFVLGCFELADTDIWWHLKTGQLIPTQGVPKTDWYTYMSAGNLWIDVHWGFQRLVAAVHGQWGAAGLVALKAALGCAAFLIAQMAYPRGGPAGVRVWAWIPALLLMSSRFYERPESVSLAFEAVFLAVLFHAEERPRLLWLLPIVQAAWANVQGLYVFGPILLAMYWCEALGRMNRTQGLFRHLIPTTVLVFVACVASPYKLDNVLLVWQIAQTAKAPEYRDTIEELKPVWQFAREGAWRTNPYLWLLAGLLAAGAASCVAAWRSWWRERRWFRILPFAAFSWLGVQALRNGNHFALVAGATLAWNLGSLRWRPHGARSAVLATLAAAVVLWAAATEHWHQWTNPQRWLGFRERPN